LEGKNERAGVFPEIIRIAKITKVVCRNGDFPRQGTVQTPDEYPTNTRNFFCREFPLLSPYEKKFRVFFSPQKGGTIPPFPCGDFLRIFVVQNPPGKSGVRATKMNTSVLEDLSAI
jgi:hypothetical protein